MNMTAMALESYEKAKARLERGELDESFRLFTEFIDGPDSSLHADELTDSYNARGHIRYLWVDFDEAIQDYTEAIKRNPNLAVAHYNRGQVHYRLGRYKLAERDLTRALELNPNFTDAQLNLDQVKSDIDRGHKFNVADTFNENT